MTIDPPPPKKKRTILMAKNNLSTILYGGFIMVLVKVQKVLVIHKERIKYI